MAARVSPRDDDQGLTAAHRIGAELDVLPAREGLLLLDRKSTRVNSSHVEITYAVFCVKKKNKHRLRHLKTEPHHRAVGRVLLHRQERERAVEQVYFFFNDTATTEIYTLSLHDALPI